MVDKYRYGVVKVKASLMDVDDSQRFALKRVGGVLGDTVSRVFLIPDDIQLWALHYAMTTAFGFLNEHLHAFHLTEEDFRRLTNDEAGGWMELCGKLFRSPFMDDEDVFWCDDYSYGNFKNWRRKKYTGPYEYKGQCETYSYCQTSLREFFDPEEEFFVGYSISERDKKEYICRVSSREENIKGEKCERFEKHKFKDLTIDMLERIYLERNVNEVLEPLTVRELMDNYTDRLIYNYDFGDDWQIMLEFSRDVYGSKEERKCLETHRPVMLYADGLNLVEDVGSVHGFAAFLLSLYGSPRDIARYSGRQDYMAYSDEFENTGCEQYEDRESSLEWAYGLEWSEKNPKLDSWF